MKVIDLLNKKANGEESKPIDYKGVDNLTYYLFDKCGKEVDETNLVNILNDEVKIIGEDKKIEKLEHMNSRDYLENRDEYLSTKAIALDIETLRNWLNKIIDYLEEKE